ncbi:hypothetical protein [Nonomuraea fuscirosea]|uniref:hypothetical protein n=1 Tax=Nonomuraea fuscirosea TaxID=1291556 RepID=UPI0034210F43
MNEINNHPWVAATTIRLTDEQARALGEATAGRRPAPFEVPTDTPAIAEVVYCESCRQSYGSAAHTACTAV